MRLWWGTIIQVALQGEVGLMFQARYHIREILIGIEASEVHWFLRTIRRYDDLDCPKTPRLYPCNATLEGPKPLYPLATNVTCRSLVYLHGLR